jgi:hypothetical protein
MGVESNFTCKVAKDWLTLTLAKHF